MHRTCQTTTNFTRLDPNGLCLEFMSRSRLYGMSVMPAVALVVARSVFATRSKQLTRPSAAMTSGPCASNDAPAPDALYRTLDQFTDKDYQQ